MTVAEYTSWASDLATVASAGLLVELLWFRLAWKYGWLFGFLLANVTQSLMVIGVSRSTLRYGIAYFGGQAVKTLLTVAVSLQLWSRALEKYPALAQFGRRVGVYLLIAAGVVAAGSLLLEPTRRALQTGWIHDFNAVEGAADFAVALFFVGVTLFLVWFPVRIPRNVAIFIGGLTFYLFVRRVALLILNLYPSHNLAISAVIITVSLGYQLFWLFRVRPSGEIVTTVMGPQWNPAEMDRLLRQLDGMNTHLEKLKRKK